MPMLLINKGVSLLVRIPAVTSRATHAYQSAKTTTINKNKYLGEKGRQHLLARPDKEPILKRVIGSSLDFPSGHSRGRERKKKSGNKNRERRKG